MADTLAYILKENIIYFMYCCLILKVISIHKTNVSFSLNEWHILLLSLYGQNLLSGIFSIHVSLTRQVRRSTIYTLVIFDLFAQDKPDLS
jgi:hypothetical protein